jgi:hypothetical protein
MAYKQKNNPLTTPVLKVEMEDDVMGKANRDGTIHINKNINNPKEIQDIVNHEKVHLDQMQRGDLDYDDKNVIWKGKKYSRSKMDEGAKNLPWEKEAYNKADESKKFSLNQHRGNSNPYQSFQDKGLISPLEQRQDPPAFKFKDLFKNKVTTTSVNRTTASQPGVGKNTPGLFSAADETWLNEQNELQQEKSLGDGFIGQTIDAGVMESNTKGPGVNVSAKKDLTYNQDYDDQNPQNADWALRSHVGKLNYDAYSGDPNFTYSDNAKGGQGGYINVSSGDDAPELDNSAQLANAKNVLSAKSYNIFGTSGLVGLRGATGNAQQGNYSTNYQFASQPELIGDQGTFVGKQSNRVLKGQKTKNINSNKSSRRNKNNNFSKAKYRTNIFGGNADNPKGAKTLLPKRQVTYNTTYDGNQIKTTATKRFTRQKFEDSGKYFATKGTGRKMNYLGTGTSGKKKFEDSQKDHLKKQQNAVNKRNQNLADLRNLQNP